MFGILGIIGGLSLVGTLVKGLWESVETDYDRRSYGWTKREGCWFDKKGFIVDFVSNPKSPIYEEECQRLREHEATLTTLYERMRDSYERTLHVCDRPGFYKKIRRK